MDKDTGTAAYDVLEIGNEFSTVQVRRLHMRSSIRLEVRAPRIDRSVTFDAMAPEGLRWQAPEALSHLLTQGGPYGIGEDEA